MRETSGIGTIEGPKGSEFKEITQEQAKFLAGIFEIGGGMFVGMTETSEKDRRPRIRFSTLISLTDKDEAKLRGLQSEFGGSVDHTTSPNSWIWGLRGRLALHTLLAMKPFSPSRQDTIRTFENLAEAEVQEEKKQIIENFRVHNKSPKIFPNKDAYQQLIKDPSFMAGILTGRNTPIHIGEANKYHIDSLNEPLLTVLGEPYGLTPVPRDVSDNRINISYRLNVTPSVMGKLAGFADRRSSGVVQQASSTPQRMSPHAA